MRLVLLVMILVSASAGCARRDPAAVGDGAVLEVAPKPRPAEACPLWAGAENLVAREQAGRGDFFREFYFDFARGVVRLHDSDPFAAGPEAKVPRVLKEEKGLEGAQLESLASAVRQVCPSEEAMKRRCAPGGCVRLEVSGNFKITRVEDPETVTRILKLFAPLFPELRSR
ncbi:MAG: hypothetical protein QM765_05390 [Myxococcales bacterium]